MGGPTLEQPPFRQMKPCHLLFSLLLLNPVAALVSAGGYIGGTLTAFGHVSSSLPFVFTFLTISAFAALSLIVLYRWGHQIPFRTMAIVSFCALLIGCSLFLAGSFSKQDALPWFIASATSSSVGTTLLFFCWLSLCTEFSFRTALFWESASVGLAGILALVVLSTSNAAFMLFILVVSPSLAAIALLVPNARFVPNPPQHIAAQANKQQHSLGSFFGKTWPVLIGALLCLFLLGLMWTEPQRASGFSYSANITQGMFIGCIASPAAIAAFSVLYPNEQNLRFACISVAPIVITLPLAACILTINPEGIIGYLLGGLTGVTCSFFFILSLSTILDSKSNQHVPLPLSWGCCCFAACLALAAGIAINQTVDPSQTMSVTLALFIGYLVALATRAFRFTSRSKKDADAKDPVDLREKACTEISAAFNLSPREAEVLAFLARGRSSTYIAQELYVSPETIRVHTKHIYEKTGVHTRQELFDLLEQNG